MKFFYSASAMHYGMGYKWHKKYNFPTFQAVTRTLTLNRRIGIPFAILKFNDSVWNRVGLHNIGLWNWTSTYYYRVRTDIIVSLAGTDTEIESMISYMERANLLFGGIELNFSCPNIHSFNNKIIPDTKYPLYLKLNHLQDPYEYDLDRIQGVRLNSIPTMFGGVSGKGAKKKNWDWIKRHVKEGLNVAGCSFNSMTDIFDLRDMGCKEIGIGSVMLTNPNLVERLVSELLIERLGA